MMALQKQLAIINAKWNMLIGHSKPTREVLSQAIEPAIASGLVMFVCYSFTRMYIATAMCAHSYSYNDYLGKPAPFSFTYTRSRARSA